MKAVILNSGLGTRMGDITCSQPKCLTPITKEETILSRQLTQLVEENIKEVIITTGLYEENIIQYCSLLDLPLNIHFVNNPLYNKTNYIYSLFCAKDYLKDDDILLMHGDLVFNNSVLALVCNCESSCMVVSSTSELPEKDFKAVVNEGKISAVGIEFFNNALAAQPLYKLDKSDWMLWLDKITDYCNLGDVNCYAEKALNEVLEDFDLLPIDVRQIMCNEIDNQADLEATICRLKEMKNKYVYMCFSTDVIHSGHISIMRKAMELGKLIVGVLNDEVVSSYKQYPLVPFEERKVLFENISGIYKVIEQSSLSYLDNLRELKPDYVVHGDDWKDGVQKPIRQEIITFLDTYGGQLIEYPYSQKKVYEELDNKSRLKLSIPDIRRGRLKKLISMKGCVSVIEAHSGITGLIAEKTVVYQEGKTYQFDAMWISSLCDSTAKGKPDIELVDMTSRFRTIDDIMEVTTKPIIFDGDTGGLTEHFVYTVRTLERMGVSAIIIEDKTGLKKNSLFGTEIEQTQDSIENFSAKISAGKRAKKTADFMIIARIESLILDKGMNDALSRASAYVAAGADGIMIHSRKKEPDEIIEFLKKYRAVDANTPIVVVPTSFNTITEEEFKSYGVNIVIYANQLTRSGFPAMQNTAIELLKNHRAKEVDDKLMSIKDIITLIPEDEF